MDHIIHCYNQLMIDWCKTESDKIQLNYWNLNNVTASSRLDFIWSHSKLPSNQSTNIPTFFSGLHFRGLFKYITETSVTSTAYKTIIINEWCLQHKTNRKLWAPGHTRDTYDKTDIRHTHIYMSARASFRQRSAPVTTDLHRIYLRAVPLPLASSSPHWNTVLIPTQ